MPKRVPIRAGVAVAAVLGVLAGAVTYRNEQRVEKAFAGAIDRRPPGEVEDLFESSRLLNPGAAREVAEAELAFRTGRPERADELLREASELEPENALVWHTWTRLALARGRRGEALRYWERVRRLDPQLPDRLPDPL